MWNMKKKKIEDRISLLSDVLLHHILSFLNTKLVVQTCVLSKRWKTLWTNIPTLNFDFDSYPFQRSSRSAGNSKKKSFKYFISKVASQHCEKLVRKLSFSAFLKVQGAELAKLLLCDAQFDTIQELDIMVDSPIDFGSLKLPSLKKLVIKSSMEMWKIGCQIHLEENSFSSCPNLECLVLISCRFSNPDYCICAPKLEHFELSEANSFVLPSPPKLELCAPNLKSLKFHNVLPTIKPASSDFLCIDRVTIALDKGYDLIWGERCTLWVEADILQLLRVFHNATSLTLHPEAAKALFKIPSPLSGCRFHNLRHMKFRSEGSRNKMIDLPIRQNTISHFIECPKLQTFAVDSTTTGSLSHVSLEDQFWYFVFCFR